MKKRNFLTQTDDDTEVGQLRPTVWVVNNNASWSVIIVRILLEKADHSFLRGNGRQQEQSQKKTNK